MGEAGVIPYTGDPVTAFKAQVLATYGTTCHLCGRTGSNTVDHLIPRSVRPDLTWDLNNARPAHRSCNSSRGTRALPKAYKAKAW